MTDPYRAFRRLERMLPGITQEKPRPYPNRLKGTLIATIIYKPDGEVVIERPNIINYKTE